MSKRTNKDLIEVYDREYAKDIYKGFFTYNQAQMYREMLAALPSWDGLKVLDVGSGQGELVAMVKIAGAESVVGIDFSKEAVAISKERYKIPDTKFVLQELFEHRGKYDVVMMNGVLEHMDEPFKALDFICGELLEEGGIIVTGSPSFINPRGFIWMTLQTLFDVPMSLTDVHFLIPADFEQYCRDKEYDLEYRSLCQELGWGESTVKDFSKRLHNALRDAGMDNSKVPKLMEWLEKTLPYSSYTEHSGAHVIYTIRT